MNQPAQTRQHSPLSATNFDLPSLHILQDEIDVALKNAETHLSEFNDDEAQAPLLLDSVDVMQQLSQILDLLALDGASDLTSAIGEIMQLLYDNGDNSDEAVILNLSEAIMTLDRYIEFVLLKETLEPTLLVPIINKLYGYLNKPLLDVNSFNQRGTGSVSISNPESNFTSPKALNLDVALLSSAYRAGLSVVLSAQDSNLSEQDRQKLLAMQSACETVSNHSNTLFWKAATAVVTGIDKILPIDSTKKRTLIFVEQQFHHYISVNDKRFADLVSFACQRQNALAENVKQEYAKNSLNERDHRSMTQFLLGPNHAVTETLNNLIQEQINTIKDSVDSLARGENTDESMSPEKISDHLRELGASMRLLNLDDAANALIAEADEVVKWQSPTPEDYDQLLSALIVAENASISMTKQHTPGAVNLPLHNTDISLHQLDTSYDAIVVEGRTNIAKIEQKFTDYLQDEGHAAEHLTEIPVLLRQVAGSLNFLHLKDASQMITRLAVYIQQQMVEGGASYDEEKLKHIANIIMAADYHLEGFENNHPVGKQAMHVGHLSLNELLVA